MFSLAYAILPFSDTTPAEAITASLAPFQRGGRGDLPESWLSFHDETEYLRKDYEARFTFTLEEGRGMRIEGGPCWCISTRKVLDEMARLGLRSWRVCFAETMDIAEFFDRFIERLERHPGTGAFGQWLNPLGRWDWWDLGGRFDGKIIGDRRRQMTARRVSKVSSGESSGRTVLANVEDVMAEALGQEPLGTLDVQNDQNIELVATLLEDARSNRGNAFPGSLVLPPGAIEDRLRWLGTWPDLGPQEAFAWLGVPSGAESGTEWKAIVRAAYARFGDHWAAGVAYHH